MKGVTMAVQDPTVTLQGAEFYFRNFSGRESQFNAEGDRNFGVYIPEELADTLIDDGWNVKYTKIREEGDVARPFLQISIGYKVRPPRITMISGGTRTPLTEQMLDILDWADVLDLDVTFAPYNWEVAGKKGVKAYLRVMYITVVQEELDAKYSDLG
jgi:hypothetical protein